MLSFIIILLILLWLTGFVSVPSFSIFRQPLFFLNRSGVTLWDLMVLTVLLWTIGILPYPLKQIGIILLILWLLAILGVIAVSGFANLIFALLIIGLILHLLGFTWH